MSRKILLSLLTIMVCSMTILTLIACSSDEVTPEISVPVGNENYFKKGINFESSASKKSFKFSTNVAWNLTVADTHSGSSWLSVSPTSGEAGTHIIEIEAKENTTYDDRNSVITIAAGDSIRKIFVNQKQMDALTLTANRFEVPVGGGDVEIEIKSNIDYIIEIPNNDKSWIHQSISNTRGLSTSKLSFSIDKCEEYDKREGKIIVKAKDKEEVVTIYQAGEGILTLTQNVYNLSSSAQELSIEINSNFDYSVDFPDVEWIKEVNAQSRGISTHTLRLNIAKNETYDGRSAKIRIYDANSLLSDEVIINQSQKDAIIIDKNVFEFDENGGSFSVKVNSNVDYKIDINCNWIKNKTVSTRSLTETSLVFDVSSITDNKDRIGKITISNANSGISVNITVNQKRTLYFNYSSLTIMEGEEKKIDINNKTGQSIIWSSSKPNIVSVDNTGILKGLSKGNAIITAKTADGLHKSECEVIVNDITDYISTTSKNGSYVHIVNGLVMYPSTIYWVFSNNSKETVKIKTRQVISATGQVISTSNTYENVGPGRETTYGIQVGVSGLRIPITCRFTYEYKGKDYSVDAIYNGTKW